MNSYCCYSLKLFIQKIKQSSLKQVYLNTLLILFTRKCKVFLVTKNYSHLSLSNMFTRGFPFHKHSV